MHATKFINTIYTLHTHSVKAGGRNDGRVVYATRALSSLCARSKPFPFQAISPHKCKIKFIP